MSDVSLFLLPEKPGILSVGSGESRRFGPDPHLFELPHVSPFLFGNTVELGDGVHIVKKTCRMANFFGISSRKEE